MNKTDRIYIAGHNGMVGSAIVRKLNSLGFENILYKSSKELDLTNQAQTEAFFDKENIDIAVIAAAKVGGIMANNTYPAEFIEENLAIALNTTRAAKKSGVKRMLFLGSTCIYPRLAPQPIPEEALLCGELEKTNEAYAVAKIAGLKMCEYYRKQYGLCYHSAMPTNLYGPKDNYDKENSHVLPALLRRFHEAKEAEAENVVIWGTGAPLREFLHVDDLASAVIYLLELDCPPDLVNVGSNQEVSIKELALTIAKVVGFKGEVLFDHTKPDGTPRKLSDSTKLRNLGWQPKFSLLEGIEATYKNFLAEIADGSIRN